MKIIRQGDPDRLHKVKRFMCRECGCIFEADKEEYKTGNQYNESYVWCECPYCANTAHEDAAV